MLDKRSMSELAGASLRKRCDNTRRQLFDSIPKNLSLEEKTMLRAKIYSMDYKELGVAIKQTKGI